MSFYNLNDSALRESLWAEDGAVRWNLSWGQAINRYSAEYKANPKVTTPLGAQVESVITAVETYVRHVAMEWSVLIRATAHQTHAGDVRDA